MYVNHSYWGIHWITSSQIFGNNYITTVATLEQANRLPLTNGMPESIPLNEVVKSLGSIQIVAQSADSVYGLVLLPKPKYGQLYSDAEEEWSSIFGAAYVRHGIDMYVICTI